MRKRLSPFYERITATLADYGTLGFSALLIASGAPNNQILSRTLRPDCAVKAASSERFCRPRRRAFSTRSRIRRRPSAWPDKS